MTRRDTCALWTAMPPGSTMGMMIVALCRVCLARPTIMGTARSGARIRPIERENTHGIFIEYSDDLAGKREACLAALSPGQNVGAGLRDYAGCPRPLASEVLLLWRPRRA